MNELESGQAIEFLEVAVNQLEPFWSEGNADREDLVRLLEDLSARGLKPEDRIFKAAQRCLSVELDDIKHFRAIAKFVKTYPDALSADEIDDLKTKFVSFAEEYCDGWDEDDPDWLQQVAADVEFVAERLNVTVDRFTDPLYERADEIESERASQRYYEDEDHGWQPSQRHVDDVDSMFKSLRYELES